MLESRSSAVSEALVKGIAMALIIPDNTQIPASAPSWSVGLSSNWARAQHVSNNCGPNVIGYLSSRVCYTP